MRREGKGREEKEGKVRKGGKRKEREGKEGKASKGEGEDGDNIKLSFQYKSRHT